MALGTGAWRVVNLDKLTYAGNLENVTDVLESPPHSVRPISTVTGLTAGQASGEW
jgi:dTDP-D-glucose 4,6-dehydratase